ncbi:MAG: hypothetical protein ABI382_10105 [Nakamurella sp.]
MSSSQAPSAPQTPRTLQQAQVGTTTRAAERARARRDRRQLKSTPARVAGAGRPVRSALARVPFVIALIVVLAIGVGGVLYLNTKIDESGIRAEQARSTTAQLRLNIEELTRTAADLNATPRLAAEAQVLGLVPSGDAAIMSIDANGTMTLLGTPTPAKADPLKVEGQ